MNEYCNFLENNPKLVTSFFQKKGMKEPKKYLIAVGLFHENELVDVFTVTKPPVNPREYTFKLNVIKGDFSKPRNMIDFFHRTYDGKIEGLD